MFVTAVPVEQEIDNVPLVLFVTPGPAVCVIDTVKVLPPPCNTVLPRGVSVTVGVL